MRVFALILMFLTSLISRVTYAEVSTNSTMSGFEKVFITAGYGTLLGAGAGVAALAFSGKPTENARYVAIGASAGFVSGVLFGGYFALVPIFSSDQQVSTESIGLYKGLGKRPLFVLEAGKKPLEEWRLHFPAINF